jgi:hypothetical protein
MERTRVSTMETCYSIADRAGHVGASRFPTNWIGCNDAEASQVAHIA